MASFLYSAPIPTDLKVGENEKKLNCREFEPSRTRTCDPLVKSQLLYRLSYRPIYMQRAREACSLGTSRGHSTEPEQDCPKHLQSTVMIRTSL